MPGPPQRVADARTGRSRLAAALAKLLRTDGEAERQGLCLRSDGYAKVDEALSVHSMQQLLEVVAPGSASGLNTGGYGGPMPPALLNAVREMIDRTKVGGKPCFDLWEGEVRGDYQYWFSCLLDPPLEIEAPPTSTGSEVASRREPQQVPHAATAAERPARQQATRWVDTLAVARASTAVATAAAAERPTPVATQQPSWQGPRRTGDVRARGAPWRDPKAEQGSAKWWEQQTEEADGDRWWEETDAQVDQADAAATVAATEDATPWWERQAQTSEEVAAATATSDVTPWWEQQQETSEEAAAATTTSDATLWQEQQQQSSEEAAAATANTDSMSWWEQQRQASGEAAAGDKAKQPDSPSKEDGETTSKEKQLAWWQKAIEQQRAQQQTDGEEENLPAPILRLSKNLASLLRHRAADEGLAVRSDGFAKLDEVLSLNCMQRVLDTIAPGSAGPLNTAGKGGPVAEQLLAVVHEMVNTSHSRGRPRFELWEGEGAADGGDLWIRATHKHSLAHVTDAPVSPPKTEEKTEQEELSTTPKAAEIAEQKEAQSLELSTSPKAVEIAEQNEVRIKGEMEEKTQQKETNDECAEAAMSAPQERDEVARRSNLMNLIGDGRSLGLRRGVPTGRPEIQATTAPVRSIPKRVMAPRVVPPNENQCPPTSCAREQKTSGAKTAPCRDAFRNVLNLLPSDAPADVRAYLASMADL